MTLRVRMFSFAPPACWIRAATLLLLFVFATRPGRIHGQEMELPVSIQVPLFLKVVQFDRLRSETADGILVVGVAYQSGFRSSVRTRDEVDRTLRVSSERKIRLVLIDLDRDNLSEVLRQQLVTLLYVAPLRGYRIEDIAVAAVSAHAMTVSGVPEYIERGLVVGARLQGERPKFLVNLPAARRGGTSFTSEFLKLAQVLE